MILNGNGWSGFYKKEMVGMCMTQAGSYVLFVNFRFFIRVRQSSGSASKLAFFEAFPL